jgi:hypothetical protein
MSNLLEATITGNGECDIGCVMTSNSTDLTPLLLIEIYFTSYFKLSCDTDSYSLPQLEILAMLGMQTKELMPPMLNN